MSAQTLEGKTVVMTGAARGMGREMSIGLAQAGAQVVMIDLDADVLEAAAADVERAGGQGAALAIPGDVTSEDLARRALAQATERYGRIDALVNDAVVGPENIGARFMAEPRKFWELDDGLWQKMMHVNLFGPQLMARVMAPAMVAQGWGRIVNITTSLDTMYRFGLGAYGPTKAGLEAHSLIMAHDLEGTGVTANVLVPGGPVATRMFPDDAGVPVDLLIRPKVMVDPIVWLCSDDSDGVSGMRFIAALWEEGLARQARIDRAGAPAAWTQLGSQAIYPDAPEGDQP